MSSSFVQKYFYFIKGLKWERVKMLLLKPLFKHHGTNFILTPDGSYSYSTIEVGDGACFLWS